MNRALHDSLFELYIDGGFELMTLGTRGLKRELIIDFEMSALTPETGEIIRYRAVNRWDEDDFSTSGQSLLDHCQQKLNASWASRTSSLIAVGRVLSC